VSGEDDAERHEPPKEDVLEGIERMPEAFLRLLHGKNFGKQTVRIH
jgi:NADPH-dependent curcumin reductase CurA